MGVGQRLVPGGVHVGGVIVVDGSDRVNGVLTPVYGALGLDWRPEATGSVADEVPGTTWDDVAEALHRRLRGAPRPGAGGAGRGNADAGEAPGAGASEP